MENIFLGIDTSNYTTSVAAVSESGAALANLKKLLEVPKGGRGLRQSDAVFAHVKAIPAIVEKLFAELGDTVGRYSVKAVGYSYAPRDAEGSYMPCFLAGEAVARSVAASCGIPCFRSSHQAGHVMAALYSASALDLIGSRFAAFHVSGGTTDVLLVTPDDEKIISVERIGGTLDLNAGQLIDRVGVGMGLDFPAGAGLDPLACAYEGERAPVKTNVHGLDCNLSGAENQAAKLYGETRDAGKTAAFVFDYVANTIARLSENLRAAYPDISIVYAGGVMSSRYIKRELARFSGHFAEPEFSSDNAVGCALLCREKRIRSNTEVSDEN